MSVTTLQAIFRGLKLATCARELEDVLANEKQAVNLSWSLNLFQREVDQRKENALKKRLHKGNFQLMRPLEEFDWDFNPTIEKEKILSLSKLDFVSSKEIVLFLGQPGTGKTHLAEAIGLKAVMSGYRVYCTSMKKLSENIELSLLRNEMHLLFKKILNNHLLILDDWGTVALSRKVTEEIFDLFDRRKLSTSMILTSNRDVKEWPNVFADPVIASAAIDRIFDRATKAIFEGKSYRLLGKKEKRPDKAEKRS